MGEVIILNNSSPAIQYLCKRDKKLAIVIEKLGDLTYKPYDDDPYAFVIHEIIEQMLSAKAGEKIYNRLVGLCNGKLTADAVSHLSFEDIKSIGTATSKVKYIQAFTSAVLNKEIKLPENTLSWFIVGKTYEDLVVSTEVFDVK